MLRIGMLGCGHIARKFANDLAFVEGVKLEAVGASHAASAYKFVSEYPVSKSYDSYEKLVADPEVDLVYIATPHAFHASHAMLCLENGKHVLCEKAFTINASEAVEVIEKANARNLFLMEAMWTKFLPHYQSVKAFIDSGKLGKLQHIQASFGFKVDKPLDQRLWNPNLGGGSLLDIGVYNVMMVQSLLGIPDEICASSRLSQTGVDASCTAQFHYRSGATAHLYSTFTGYTPIEVFIQGSEGRLHLSSRYYAPSSHVYYYSGMDDTRQEWSIHKEEGWGYQFQVRHVIDCVQKGLLQSPVMSWQDTLKQMETMDRIRAKAGIKYPADKF
jgi:predicted dehydrogenase